MAGNNPRLYVTMSQMSVQIIILTLEEEFTDCQGEFALKWRIITQDITYSVFVKINHK